MSRNDQDPNAPPGGIPPILRPGPSPRARRRLSVSRILIWSTLLVVAALRFAFPPERGPRPGPAPWFFGDDRSQRFRRPPTRVSPPVAPVPADLPRLHIEIAQNDVEKLEHYYWNGRGARREDRVEVSATVREGGQVYTNVALHLKGAAGSFRPFVDKPALTLNFGPDGSNQKFHGYSKISLNNSVQDPSFLCEIISRELFDAAGVPVPRADHATVIINGRDLGLYVLTEGFGKPFLKRYFKNTKGNLYDSGFVQDITGGLTVNSGDNRQDRSSLRRLIDAAGERDPDRRWQRLNQVLDMDRFISFLAMEIMTCHWDGYAMNHNNYRIFHDLDTDKLVFIPHGMDQMFGVFRSHPTSTIRPGMSGMIARLVTSTPEGRHLYLERIAALRTNVFLPEKLTNRVQQIARRLHPTLTAYGPLVAAEHQANVDYLCDRIVQRAESISEQLLPPADPLQFDAEGRAHLSGWEGKTTPQARTQMRFERGEREGRPVLLITAARGGGSGSGSWRARARVPSGQYRFEARARTAGAGPAGGVCLRVSGARNIRPQPSDDGWTLLTYPVTVDLPDMEVELICEFRSSTGEAAFDEASLQLIRE